MASKSRYEGQLLEALRELPEKEQALLLRLVRFLKEEFEIFPSSTATSARRSSLPDEQKAAILRHAGLLDDLTPEEAERFAEVTRRRPHHGAQSDQNRVGGGGSAL